VARSRMRTVVALIMAAALIAAACTSDDDSDAAPDSTTPPTAAEGAAEGAVDRSYSVLPPGNYGGLPTNEHSLDQLPLYDGLTPLRGDITDADIEDHFLAQDFEPIGETTEEPTGRDGVEILYDEWGVPHITGETREDLAFGAGWVTARDRGLLLDFGRGPARAAVADIPGIDAFELVTSAREFVPSAEAEALVTEQVDLLVEEYGDEGEEMVADAEAYAAGINAYWEANAIDREPATANDVIAVTAFIGSIFGAGGGGEVDNATLLAEIQGGLGDETGQQAWEDVMLMDDPEAPTTLEEEFDYPVLTGGDVTGSVELDAGSIVSFDPLGEGGDEADGDGAGEVGYDAAGAPPARQASNWLLVDPSASENATTMGVLGPQLGYYYPEIVQQLHLSGPGIEAQGAAVPGLAMYILIGRTPDYAWSLTSASHDVRDVFAETLCEPDGSEPTADSNSYEFDGECQPFEVFDAGTLDGVPISYRVSVHGPVIGTATSEGRPVALARQRSTFGRDGLNLVALKRMTEGVATTPEDFYETANQFGFTFNWGWVGRQSVAYFTSVRLPVRAEGLDRRLPTSGTGDYEWNGFLDQGAHPHGTPSSSGRLVNWNNKSAPGFMHGDGNSYGSVHRVEMFDEWPEQVDLAGTVGVMNRAATQWPDSQVWPVVSEVLAGGDAPSEQAQALVDYLDAWVDDNAPAVDADDDGLYDDGGPAIMDALYEPMVLAAIAPVFGELAPLVYEERGLGGDNGQSILDKDLRTLLGEEVDGPFNLQYCGSGSQDDCRAALWTVVETAATELASQYGGDDPATWLMEGRRTEFVPNLIPETFRTTNRPTFQQLIELTPSSGD
jgi:acyl-homoserine lactone acylase PvdQ